MVAGAAAPSGERGSAKPFGAFERMVAFRYLRARRQDTFVSVIALISFVGITLGVATLIIVMAVMNGFREDLMSRLLGVNGHVIVRPVTLPIADPQTLSQRLQAIEGVRLVAPVVAGEVLASGPGGSGEGARVRGLRAADIAAMPGIDDSITAGTLDGFDESGGVLVGASLAAQVGLPLGERVTLVSPTGEETDFGINPNIVAFPIVGLLSTGQAEFDLTAVLMPFEDAATFFATGGATQMEIFLDDPQNLDAVLPAINAALGEDYSLTDWRQANASLFDALQIERNVMFMVLTLILIVAALNIVSGLVMLVKDKGADIGILRSMGASRLGVLRVFVMTGATIGISGTLAGLVLGVVFALNIDLVHAALGFLTGETSGLALFLSRLPAALDGGETISVVAMSIILTLVAAAFPAWRAAALDPVKALRGG